MRLKNNIESFIIDTGFQALDNNDHIWATVVSGVNQDGHTVTPVTAPSGTQQEKLMTDIYTKYGVDVSRLDYIEAHGRCHCLLFVSASIVYNIHNFTYCKYFILHKKLFNILLESLQCGARSQL